MIKYLYFTMNPENTPRKKQRIRAFSANPPYVSQLFYNSKDDSEFESIFVLPFTSTRMIALNLYSIPSY